MLTKYAPVTMNINADQYFWGEKGTDYDAQKRLINKHKNISGKNVLVYGAGLGFDTISLLRYKPRKIVAYDKFDLSSTWLNIIKRASEDYGIEVEFIHGTEIFNDRFQNSFDLITSNAVHEHIMDLEDLMQLYQGMLRQDGIIFASHSQYLGYGADHFSGKDKFDHGYNHILLEQKEYRDFLDSYGELGFPDMENDGRFWIYNEILNDYSLSDFLELYKKKFCLAYFGVKIDQRTVAFKKSNPHSFQRLIEKISPKNESELYVKGLQVILTKVDKI
jgi:SAM-dependent methyltransferase